MEDSASTVRSQLPDHIMTILNRKSSRDPNSRFVTKLSMLLQYVDENPNMEDSIGLRWTSDTEFRMNKRTVAQVMNVKINTINVNLKDLNFVQLERDRNGWTRWSKEGLTKGGVDQQVVIGSPTETSERQGRKRKQRSNPDTLTLGKVQHQLAKQFQLHVDTVWTSLFGVREERIPSLIFLERTAREFMQEGQPFENAVDIVRAIILPDQQEIAEKNHLYRLLAMFGPRETFMLKISDLIGCSNGGGNWLYFAQSLREQMVLQHVYGHFDESECNRLVIKYLSGKTVSLWNLPNVEHGQKYVIDEEGQGYYGWKEYFQQHPLERRPNPQPEDFTFSSFV